MLKKAWDITRNNRQLWVFGVPSAVFTAIYLIAMLAPLLLLGGVDLSALAVEAWAPIAVVGILLGVIAAAAWVLCYAGAGSLIHGANVAASGGVPAVKECWSIGFQRWGRTFMTRLVSALPVFVVTVLPIIVAVIVFGALLASGDEDTILATMGIGSIAMMAVVGVLSIVQTVLSVITGIVWSLGICYGVLSDYSFGQALRQGWADLRVKRGAFTFYLVATLAAWVYSMALSVVVMVLMLPSIMLFAFGQFGWGFAALIVAIVVLVLPTPVWAVFVDSAWVIFFRRMTGLDPVVAPVSRAVVTPAYPAAAGSAHGPASAPTPADA